MSGKSFMANINLLQTLWHNLIENQITRQIPSEHEDMYMCSKNQSL